MVPSREHRQSSGRRCPAGALVPDQLIQEFGCSQLGGQGSCQAGLEPGAAAVLDWQDKPDGTIQPKLTASVCLQNTTGTYRVALQLYHLGSDGHVMISESKSLAATGNGAAVNDFSVNLQGPKVLGATVTHAHAQLQEQEAGVWKDVEGIDRLATADF